MNPPKNHPHWINNHLAKLPLAIAHTPLFYSKVFSQIPIDIEQYEIYNEKILLYISITSVLSFELSYAPIIYNHNNSQMQTPKAEIISRVTWYRICYLDPHAGGTKRLSRWISSSPVCFKFLHMIVVQRSNVKHTRHRLEPISGGSNTQRYQVAGLD